MNRFTRVLLAAATIAALGAQPAAAEDLIYRFRPMQHLSVLKAYNHQPYWKVLSECAGVYGGLVNHYQSQGSPRLNAAKAEGVRFLNAATSRLQKDRGLDAQQALDLTREPVETGRLSATQMLAEPSPPNRSHEQMIEMFCTQIMDAHDSSSRWAGR